MPVSLCLYCLERAAQAQPGSVLAQGVCAVPGTLRMGFATGALQVMGTGDNCMACGTRQLPHALHPIFIFLQISHMRAQRLYQSVLVAQSSVNKN